MIEGSIGYPPTVVALFLVLAIGAIALDLFAHRQDKAVPLGSAIAWSCLWIAIALGFWGYLLVQYGEETAALFLAGYTLELVLSVDNLMVFVAIFTAFAIPEKFRHRALLYGVIGAIVLRLLFVALGTAIYALGAWVEVVFALIIAWTAVKMLQQGSAEAEIADYTHHWSVRLTSRFVPIWPRLHGHNFFVNRDTVDRELLKPENRGLSIGRRAAYYATPLFLCLIVIDVADVIFAFDSVPAIIAVTKDPLLVYSAMIFAVLGLRSLYFVLAALQRYLAHLAKAVVVLLFFIAVKLLVSAGNHMIGWPGFDIDADTSLLIVLGVLAAGVVASFVFPAKGREAHPVDVTEAKEREAMRRAGGGGSR